MLDDLGDQEESFTLSGEDSESENSNIVGETKNTGAKCKYRTGKIIL